MRTIARVVLAPLFVLAMVGSAGSAPQCPAGIAKGESPEGTSSASVEAALEEAVPTFPLVIEFPADMAAQGSDAEKHSAYLDAVCAGLPNIASELAGRPSIPPTSPIVDSSLPELLVRAAGGGASALLCGDPTHRPPEWRVPYVHTEC